MKQKQKSINEVIKHIDKDNIDDFDLNEDNIDDTLEMLMTKE